MSNISYQLYTLLDAGWRHRYIIILPILLFPVIGFSIGVFTAKHTPTSSMLIQETSN